MNAPQAKNTAELRNLAAVSQQTMQRLDMFTPDGIGHAMKLARLYQTSSAVPVAFRDFIEKKGKNGVELVENPNAIGNCIVAIETAMTVGMSITAVMQNANVIEGRLSWSGQFVIASLNASGRFTPLRFETRNLGKIKAKYKEKGGWDKVANRYEMTEHEIEIDNYECIAWAYYIENGVRTSEKVTSIPVSMKMAVEEGWYAKAGSKWQTELKFQMLQYRAATFLGRIAAPDIIMGLGRTAEEHADIIDVHPQDDGVLAANVSELRQRAAAKPAPAQSQVEAEDAQNVTTVDSSRPAEPENDSNDAQETKADTNTLSQAQDTGAPTYAFVLGLIERCSYDEALELARNMSPEDADEINSIVKEQRAKTQVQRQAKARPARRDAVDMGS